VALYVGTFSVPGVNTADTVLANLKAAASDRLRLIEMGVFSEVAPSNAPIPYLQRMNAVGTGAITSAAGVPHDNNETAATGVVETAWATLRPTILANTRLRRFSFAAAAGNGIVWDFRNAPIIIPASGGLLLVNAAAAGATLGTIGGYFVWDE
jgi:hypothetical protein